jgi:hypothetical protein
MSASARAHASPTLQCTYTARPLFRIRTLIDESSKAVAQVPVIRVDTFCVLVTIVLMGDALVNHCTMLERTRVPVGGISLTTQLGNRMSLKVRRTRTLIEAL